MVKLENISDNDRLYILYNLEKLIAADFDPTLRIDKWGVNLQMFIEKDELPRVKEVLGLKKCNALVYVKKKPVAKNNCV